MTNKSTQVHCYMTLVIEAATLLVVSDMSHGYTEQIEISTKNSSLNSLRKLSFRSMLYAHSVP